MELELERTALDGFTAVLDTAVAQEETMESIVPDACPDLLGVCDTEGVVCLHRKEAMEGRVELSGTIHAMLLCQPEGEVGLRRLEVDLPFTCTADAAAITPGCKVVAEPRLRGADARLVNPRKVLVRADLAVDVQVFAPVADWACASVLEPEQAGVEQLSEPCQTCVTVCVQEKPFPFSDELTLPGSRPEGSALLKWRVALECGEAKVIGSKLIFKGSARLQVLYRCADGGLSTGEFELPISQLMEVSGAGEEAMCQVGLVLTDLSCELDDGDGRTISVSMGLLAQAVVREERSMTLLTDVYSTLYDLNTQVPGPQPGGRPGRAGGGRPGAAGDRRGGPGRAGRLCDHGGGRPEPGGGAGLPHHPGQRTSALPHRGRGDHVGHPHPAGILPGGAARGGPLLLPVCLHRAGVRRPHRRRGGGPVPGTLWLAGPDGKQGRRRQRRHL